MSHWERLATQSQTYAESDFQKAGYRLFMEQVLYASDPRSRLAYELIVRHRKEYDALLAQLGMTITHNPHMGYVVATPSQYVADKMRLSETRLALVLRRLYDDKMHVAEIAADGGQGGRNNGLVKRRQKQRDHGAEHHHAGLAGTQEQCLGGHRGPSRDDRGLADGNMPGAGRHGPRACAA